MGGGGGLWGLRGNLTFSLQNILLDWLFLQVPFYPSSQMFSFASCPIYHIFLCPKAWLEYVSQEVKIK